MIILTPLVPLNDMYSVQLVYFLFSCRYYLKKRDTLAILVQDEVQQVYKDIVVWCGMMSYIVLSGDD